MKAVVNTDGGARGNPGPAAIGVVVKINNSPVYEIGEYIGVGTNNEAEYKAIVAAAEWLVANAKKNDVDAVEFLLDSMLVVQQLKKKWKIKEPRLRVLAQSCWSALDKLNFPHSISHVARNQNVRADELVNQALDHQADSQ